MSRRVALAAVAVGVLVGAGVVAALGGTAATVDEPAERGEDAQITDTVPPPNTPYRLPVSDAAAGWHPTHSSYPATDVFLPCGADIVSPVFGTVVHVRRVDSWTPAVDDPSTRGGRSVAIVGADGVRYYFAHFQTIDPSIAVGLTVEPGRYLGALGDSGRTSACHLHFGISPPCAGDEWWVRRGVVWPAPYLDAWRDGRQVSPAPEVETWAAAHPDACTDPTVVGAN